MSQFNRFRRNSKGARDIEEYGFGMERIQFDVDIFDGPARRARLEAQAEAADPRADE